MNLDRLGRAARRSEQRAGDRRARVQDVLENTRRADLPAAAVAGARTRQLHRLRNGARRSRRSRPRGVDGGARPVARRRTQEPAARAGAPERSRRHAATAPRSGSGESKRARHFGRRHQRDAVGRVGRFVHQRLHRSRPREARVHAGRCAVPHGAGGSGTLVRALVVRNDGAVLVVHELELATGTGAARTLQRPARRSTFRGKARPASAPAPRWTKWNGSSPTLPKGFGLEWTGASYQETVLGRTGAGAVHDLAARRVPVSRGTVRKLGGAGRRDAGGAARHRRRRARRDVARTRQRHLLPGRPACDDGTRREERDSDRRVRGSGTARAASMRSKRRCTLRDCACGRF